MADSFDETTDVVVVGGGGSGLAAAIEAATLGRRVILLEKANQLGGTTAQSIGSISATSTPHQLARNVKDNPQGHFEDLPKFATHLKADDNPELRRILTDRVPDTFRWLMSLGVQFFGPMPEPPHSAPRMHNVVPNSRAYIAALDKEARRLGVDLRLSSRARRLAMSEGRVTGIEVEGPGGTSRIRGGAVVLASGDYSASPALKQRYISEIASRIAPVNPNSTGDGHTMAAEFGAKVLNGHLAHIGLRFVAPPRRPLAHALPAWPLAARFARVALERLPAPLIRPFMMKLLLTVMEPSQRLYDAGAVLVGLDGRLIADSADNKAERLGAQAEHRAFVLFDGAIARQFSEWPGFISTAPGVAYAYLLDYEKSRPDLTHKAGTPAAVASSAGMDGARLAATIEEVNARRPVSGGLPQLTKGPFYLLGPVQLFTTFTDGGLAVDTSLRVLGESNQPIPGLYAAGSTGQGGLLLEGHGHHLGWAFTSGRLAGRNAAYETTAGRAAAV